MAGAGTGSTPCSVFTVPLPTFTGALYTASMLEQIESGARADDIADRIHRAHFVEMDLLDLNAMHLGFGLAQSLKHRGGILLRPVGDAGFVDDLENLLQVPMAFSIRRQYAELGRRDPTPLGLFHLELRAGAQSSRAIAQAAALSAPASISAPTVMSPLMPENASR